MRNGFALALLLWAGAIFAGPVPELKLLSEHAVDGMRGGRRLEGLRGRDRKPPIG